MNDLHEDRFRDPANTPPHPHIEERADLSSGATPQATPNTPFEEQFVSGPPGTSPVVLEQADALIAADLSSPAMLPVPMAPDPLPPVERPLFQSFTELPVKPPARIPHFGHLAFLAALGVIGFLCTVVFLFLAMRLHLFGLKLDAEAATNIHVILASEAILYIVTFALSLFAFPPIWNEGFFAGIQWRGTVAHEKFWLLASLALGCFGLAALDEILMPGPSNAPIEKMIRTPGAAWLMFGFGVTIAPFFEEMFFRGFLLPALCTAWDWASEHIKHTPSPPLDANGHPQWSSPAMIVGSILTSLPFAGIHAQQQGNALGPFLLLIVISMVLCAVRLKTRSLAASTLVHATYNFMLFSLLLIASGGFHHLNKM
jgi:CAAX protease family protein